MQEESQLTKITRDSAKITAEQVHGLMSQVTIPCLILFCCEGLLPNISFLELNNTYMPLFQVIKDILFNTVRQSKPQTESSDPEPMVET